MDPFKVIAYFQNADCVVTDTFHGTIMSVITHRQFVSVIRESGYGNSQKMSDLLERLKLQDRSLSSMKELKKLEKEIDYNSTDELIQTERKNTREYLKQWVS